MKITENIRSVCHSHEPYVSEYFIHWPSKKCSFPGTEAELSWQMLTALGFRVQFIKANSTEEMFNMIANGSADITCICKGLTSENFRFRDPTIPVNEDYPIFILPEKGESSMDSNLLLSTCHWSIWLTCLTLALCCFAGGHFIKKIGRPEFSSMDSFISVPYYLALGVVLGVCRGLGAGAGVGLVQLCNMFLHKSYCMNVSTGLLARHGGGSFFVLMF